MKRTKTPIVADRTIGQCCTLSLQCRASASCNHKSQGEHTLHDSVLHSFNIKFILMYKVSLSARDRYISELNRDSSPSRASIITFQQLENHVPIPLGLFLFEPKAVLISLDSCWVAWILGLRPLGFFLQIAQVINIPLKT